MRAHFFFLLIASCSFLTCSQKIITPDYYKLRYAPPELASRIEPDSINFELLEYAIFLESNLQRERLGLWPLKFEPRAQLAARRHSEEMVTFTYFSHTSPISKNRTAKMRLSQAGLREGTVGENIAIHPVYKRQDILVEKRTSQFELPRDFWRNHGVHFTYGEFAKTLVERWMNSPGHRSNILSSYFRFLGVGCALGKLVDTDVFYVTQDFSSTNY